MNTKLQILLSFLIFLLFTALFLAFVFFPNFKKITLSQGEIFQTLKEIQSLQAKVQKLPEYKQVEGKIISESEKIEKILINSEIPIEFLQHLESTAKDCKVNLKILSLQKEKLLQDNLQALTIQISVNGKFPDIFCFLKQIENSNYLVQITNLNITKLEKEKVIEANFQLEVFGK
jgi:Tfp pilus assembly protein PilO